MIYMINELPDNVAKTLELVDKSDNRWELRLLSDNSGVIISEVDYDISGLVISLRGTIPIVIKNTNLIHLVFSEFDLKNAEDIKEFLDETINVIVNCNTESIYINISKFFGARFDNDNSLTDDEKSVIEHVSEIQKIVTDFYEISSIKITDTKEDTSGGIILPINTQTKQAGR